MEKVYEEAMERKASKMEEILKALTIAGKDGMLNTQLSNISLRYGAITNALQLEGYDITLENLGGGVILYTLNDTEKVEKTVVEKALDVIKREMRENYESLLTFDELVEVLDKHSLHIKYKPNGIKKTINKNRKEEVPT